MYATAKPGVRTRIASAAAGRARDRRHRWLLEICERSPGMRVVDIGCGPLGLRAWAPRLDITGVDLRPQPGYPGPFVCADATRPLPFGDAEFDLAFCNSVIEHVPFARRVLL
ncbi:MAG TPA: class I SAM-dependent methyltransferase, partial [Solirubrobacteraceae bacterium]|nr:class I SAM-dependent methyltransferase [Solirubrobacteraceae bacterium]